MDIKVNKSPFPVGGVLWPKASRWIIGTKERAFIITPQCNLLGDAPSKNEVSAAVEVVHDIEGISQIESLSSSLQYSEFLVILATDSSVRVFVSPRDPEHINWYEIAKHSFETGPDHVCSISSTSLSYVPGDAALPVVACGTMGGSIDFISLVETGDGQLNTQHKLRVQSSKHALGYLAWLESSLHLSSDGVLAACAADGSAEIWSVSSGLAQAYPICSIETKDWRQITAHGCGKDFVVLAKLGSAVIVDFLSSSEGPTIQQVALGVSQTITSCAVDRRRNRVYIGSYDFNVFVLERKGDEWIRLHQQEAVLKAGMKKTIVRSFTSKFMMNSLFLKGMHVSPNGRYLLFMADDQTNWDIVLDGLAVTRVHYHQFDDWTAESTKESLARIVNGEYECELRYNLWELLNESTADDVLSLAQYLLQMDLSDEHGMQKQQQQQQQQRLYILNYINSTFKDERISTMLRDARDKALDMHVERLFAYIHSLLSNGSIDELSDEDRAYLAQVNWAVNQPVYATIAKQLPKLESGHGIMQQVNCPICQKEMKLYSRQVAVCERNHIFDTCSVTLEILKMPGSDKCSVCNAKRRCMSNNAGSMMARLKSEYSLCPFCNGRFYSAL